MHPSHFIFNLISQLSTEQENEATTERTNQSSGFRSAAAASRVEHTNTPSRFNCCLTLHWSPFLLPHWINGIVFRALCSAVILSGVWLCFKMNQRGLWSHVLHIMSLLCLWLDPLGPLLEHLVLISAGASILHCNKAYWCLWSPDFPSVRYHLQHHR